VTTGDIVERIHKLLRLAEAAAATEAEAAAARVVVPAERKVDPPAAAMLEAEPASALAVLLGPDFGY
jgi:hypothetical protein